LDSLYIRCFVEVVYGLSGSASFWNLIYLPVFYYQESKDALIFLRVNKI
jgi:hypothetical protein